MPYTKNTWLDEILAGDARYNILEDGGGAFKSTMRINLSTSVTQAGTALNAARMNNIEGELQILSDALLYKLAVSVSSNDLVVALQHSDGTDPSSTRPLYFRIGGVWRACTAATTITIVDGTNWFNAGSAEFAAKEIDYFAYVVWDSNSSVVALTIARIPCASIVSDFVTTTTSEKHCFNFTNFTSTDNVVNIGRFAATLGVSATYLWTVPAFTNANLIQEPIDETRWLTWAPTLTGFSAAPTSTTYRYKVVSNIVYIQFTQAGNGTSNTTGFTATLPVVSLQTTGTLSFGAVDNSVLLTTPSRLFSVAGSSSLTFQKDTASGAWTASGGKRASFQMFIEW